MIRSVISKSVMAPPRSGRTATMYPGVRPLICQASRPVASTSPVWRLRAMTDGSLSTMPRPFMYTSVFAVPRSIAKSRATVCLLALAGFARVLHAIDDLTAGLRRERVDVLTERLNAIDRATATPFQPDDGERDRDGGHDHDDRGGHRSPLDSTVVAGVNGFEPVPQSEPPSQTSCFQIGTLTFSASMP